MRFTQFVTTFAVPVLNPLGFRRRGNVFHLSAANGDLAIVAFRSWSAERNVVSFYVEEALAPVPYVDWIYRDDADRGSPSEAWGIWRHRLLQERWPRVAIKGDSGMRSTWEYQTSVEPGDFQRARATEVAGEELAKALSSAVPKMLEFLARERLIAAIRDDDQFLRIRMGETGALAILLSDKGESPELQHVLETIDEFHQVDPVAAWVRQRVRLHGHD